MQLRFPKRKVSFLRPGNARHGASLVPVREACTVISWHRCYFHGTMRPASKFLRDAEEVTVRHLFEAKARLPYFDGAEGVKCCVLGTYF